jgi:hypothetical protein
MRPGLPRRFINPCRSRVPAYTWPSADQQVCQLGGVNRSRREAQTTPLSEGGQVRTQLVGAEVRTKCPRIQRALSRVSRRPERETQATNRLVTTRLPPRGRLTERERKIAEEAVTTIARRCSRHWAALRQEPRRPHRKGAQGGFHAAGFYRGFHGNEGSRQPDSGAGGGHDLAGRASTARRVARRDRRHGGQESRESVERRVDQWA